VRATENPPPRQWSAAGLIAVVAYPSAYHGTTYHVISVLDPASDRLCARLRFFFRLCFRIPHIIRPSVRDSCASHVGGPSAVRKAYDSVGLLVVGGFRYTGQNAIGKTVDELTRRR